MRYLPHSRSEIEEMLQKIGVRDIDELFEQIPAELRFKGTLDLPAPLSEPELMAHLTELSSRTGVEQMISFAGAGAYCHHVSPAVDQLLLRSEFYTAYTPYQPEISQGTLQAIFEYQTMMCRILGMRTANASMYDGGSAAAEAVLMARRVVGGRKAAARERVLISAGVHPEYREVIATYLSGLDSGCPKVEIVPLNPESGVTDLNRLEDLLGDDVCAVVVGYPNFFGVIEPIDEVAAIAQASGALTISTTAEPFALGVLSPPGELGVDIAVAEGQPLGLPVSFGGPGFGIFACRDDRKLTRQLPGRLVGKTVDTTGKAGFVLTLATREQHIRREKATSNICTNQGLCALAATIHLSLLGKTGFEQVAHSCLARAEYLKAELYRIDGFDPLFSGPTFNEFAVRCTRKPVDQVLVDLQGGGILGGVALGRFDPLYEDALLIAVTECHSAEMIKSYLELVKKY